MSFKFSSRSIKKLEGVHPDLIKVMKSAIEISAVDFGISCGRRTKAEQIALVEAKRSQTLNSKHLPQASDGFSHAVDTLAYVNNEVCWELPVYHRLGDAILQSAREHGVALRWGCCWHIANCTSKAYWDKSCEDLMNMYIDARRSQGRAKSIFLDGPHWELSQ